ncbi:MAG: 1-deoxy-D-xylulose-5-phosphate reductoisomerase [Clostridia bacterium]|nr:1-deoxy-D-xylulose-5-phosphate reductoisomerase [Clostridia bacterium]
MIIDLAGSTGSIGVQTLDVARRHGYKIATLSAYSNVDLIERQAREFRPAAVALIDETAARELSARLADTDIRVLVGSEGVLECAGSPGGDTFVNAIVGLAGFRPTLEAIGAGKKICLANKETMVAGGEIVKKRAKERGVKILPIDSEHSAIFQCLQGAPPDGRIKRIILTASGGPFFGKTKNELENVTVEDALKHPNWSMGAKITVDSATMFNKGLELIEAVRLFDVSPDAVTVVVQRESVLHSAVEFEDNSIIAQLGVPDMRLPIQYALTWPDRFDCPTPELDFFALGRLTFYPPDEENFPCLGICREAARLGGLYPACANSANEEANRLFREGRVKFNDIPALIGRAMESDLPADETSVEAVFETDRLARSAVLSACGLTA